MQIDLTSLFDKSPQTRLSKVIDLQFSAAGVADHSRTATLDPARLPGR